MNPVSNTAIPTVTTASVTTYPTSLFLNSLTPSIVYERHIGAPVFSNFVPLAGIDCKENTKKEYTDEKEIDDFITKRVQEKINEYQKQEEKHKLENIFIYTDCHCQCNKSREEKELTLDEKIERIREELNLTKETDDIKLFKNLNDFESIINLHKIDNKQTNNFKKHYKLNHDEAKFDFSCTNLEKEKKSSNTDQIINNKFEIKFSNQSTLDDKMGLIHHEQNLSKQNFEYEFGKKMLENQTRNEQVTKRHKAKESEYSSNLRTHYQINSKMSNKQDINEQDKKNDKIDQKINESKDKIHFEKEFEPPTVHRSHWIPTGSNDYSHTNSKRGDLLKKQRHLVPLNSEPSACFYHKNPTKDKSSILTVKTYRPAQTIYETTVVNRPISSCYVLDASKKPFKNNRTFFSVTKEYFNHPVSRSKTFCI